MILDFTEDDANSFDEVPTPRYAALTRGEREEILLDKW